AVAAQPTVLLSPGSIRSRCASPHDTLAGYSGDGREGGTVARDRERGDAGTDLLPNVGPQSARNCARLVRPGVGSTCSMKLPRFQCEHMPWQEVPEIVGNCRVFGRIMYCGEKCWIEGALLLPSGENVSACLPSRASRVRVPSPAPSVKIPGPKASPEIGAR